MNNSEAWENYKFYTRDITEFLRKLSFAGIAIVWIIRPYQSAFDGLSLMALIFIVMYFLADISQYLVGTSRWRNWINSEEKRNIENKDDLEGDYCPPESLDKPVFLLFWVKSFFIVLGFVSLGAEILKRFT